MLKMVTIETIRKKRSVEGWSIRRIARELGVSRKSIRKALRSDVVEPPKYKLSRPKPSPVMDQYIETIKVWLEADKEGPRKQRHTARKIYDRLKAEFGFSGAESTVRRFVAGLRHTTPEAFIPLTADAGELAEVDWGEAYAVIGGIKERVFVFCFRMRFSGICYARAYRISKLEAFLDGHVQAFEWVGGIPASIRYDNPKTAVVRILSGPEREEHQTFSAFRAHHLFDSIFCRPGKGHEKGAVENLVGFVRKNAMVPVPNVKSLDELNRILAEWSEEQRKARSQAWEIERQMLLPLPVHAFPCCVTQLRVVSKICTVTWDRNRYSVPTKYVCANVRVCSFADRIEIYFKDELIAKHDRLYGRGEDSLKLEHYLSEIGRKKRAVLHATVVRELPQAFGELRAIMCKQSTTGYREFAAVLMLLDEYPMATVESAIKEAVSLSRCDVATIRQILVSGSPMLMCEPVMLPQGLEEAKVKPPDLSLYDDLTIIGA